MLTFTGKLVRRIYFCSYWKTALYGDGSCQCKRKKTGEGSSSGEDSVDKSDENCPIVSGGGCTTLFGIHVYFTLLLLFLIILHRSAALNERFHRLLLK